MNLILAIVNIVSMIIGIICYRSVVPNYIKKFVLYYIFSVLIDNVFLEFISNKTLEINILYGLLFSTGYFVYVHIFNQKISYNSFRYIAQLFGIFVLISFTLYKFIYSPSDKNIVNNIFLIHCILTIFTVLLYFKDILETKEVIYLSKDPLFWIATGLLFFMTGNAVSTGFYHQLYDYSKVLAKTLYKLNYVLNILMSILFSISFIISTSKNHIYAK